MEREQVQKTALLARLKLSEAELTTFTGQLTSLLDYVAILDEVDTDNVEPMAHAVEVSNVFRDDAPTAPERQPVRRREGPAVEDLETSMPACLVMLGAEP